MRRAATAATVVLLLVTLAPASAAVAQPGADPPPGTGLLREVAAVPATSVELDGRRAEARRAVGRRDRVRDELAGTRSRLERAATERDALGALARRRTAEAERLAPVAARLRTDLRRLATEGFVTGFGVADALDPTLTSAERVRRGRLRVLAGEALGDTVHDERTVAATLRRLRRDGAALGRRARSTAATADGLRTDVVRLERGLAGATAEVERTAAAVERAKVGALVDGTDLPLLALDAYVRAARTLRAADPSCGVPWWALAGIGRTESRHGHYRGSEVDPDGVVAPAIYGPPLDGSNGFAVVGDSDGGALDALSTSDRAVGPMQFLPGTWRTVGRDATGDGRADPQNLYDAALGAGALLCRSGPGLTDEASLRRSFRRYNNSAEYVQIVWERARSYAADVPLD